MTKKRYYRTPLEKHILSNYIQEYWKTKRPDYMYSYLNGMARAYRNELPDHPLLPELDFLRELALIKQELI